MKRIILCADDYGQNSAISQAIIELIKKNRLSATSCMTNSTHWLSDAEWLRPLKEKVHCGVHFNLTEGKPLSKGFGSESIPLPQLIVKAYLRQLDQAAIEAELEAQIDQFKAGLGKDPDFIDGHQHIQQLPVIRQALFNVYEKQFRHTPCYIRSVCDSKIFSGFGESGYLKKMIIQLLGAKKFKHELKKRQIPHNTSFGGIYDFKDAKNYPRYFLNFVKKIQDQGIIMCHPSVLGSKEEKDYIGSSRYQEYQYFQSDLFKALCSEHEIVLG